VWVYARVRVCVCSAECVSVTDTPRFTLTSNSVHNEHTGIGCDVAVVTTQSSAWLAHADGLKQWRGKEHRDEASAEAGGGGVGGRTDDDHELL
jgi:hypothetical protein